MKIYSKMLFAILLILSMTMALGACSSTEENEAAGENDYVSATVEAAAQWPGASDELGQPEDLQESDETEPTRFYIALGDSSSHSQNTITVTTQFYATQFYTTQFYIPVLDLRGYDLDHFEVESWLLSRINYHRVNYGIHGYELYIPAVVTSIEHSLDMRDNEFSRNAASDGRTHQQRHDRWMGIFRTRVTSAHSSGHDVAEGPFTMKGAYAVIDRIMQNETTFSFLMNPIYYYIGIGFSIQENGRSRLSITMASVEGERQAHRDRTREEREAHRQEYLERVRAERAALQP